MNDMHIHFKWLYSAIDRTKVQITDETYYQLRPPEMRFWKVRNHLGHTCRPIAYSYTPDPGAKLSMLSISDLLKALSMSMPQSLQYISFIFSLRTLIAWSQHYLDIVVHVTTCYPNPNHKAEFNHCVAVKSGLITVISVTNKTVFLYNSAHGDYSRKS